MVLFFGSASHDSASTGMRFPFSSHSDSLSPYNSANMVSVGFCSGWYPNTFGKGLRIAFSTPPLTAWGPGPAVVEPGFHPRSAYFFRRSFLGRFVLLLRRAGQAQTSEETQADDKHSRKKATPTSHVTPPFLSFYSWLSRAALNIPLCLSAVVTLVRVQFRVYSLSLMTFPVTLSFQEPLCCIGQLKEIAPGCLQSLTQQPQYQHSSGCRIMGGSPFTGLGINTSTWHTFTQVLHPLQISGLKVTGALGVAMLGKAFIFNRAIKPPHFPS